MTSNNTPTDADGLGIWANIGIWMSFGVLFGLLVGLFFGNIGLGIALGPSVGVAAWALFVALRTDARRGS